MVALLVKPAPQPALAPRPAREAWTEDEKPDLDLSALEEALALEEAGEPAVLAAPAQFLARTATGPVNQIEI